MVRFFVTFYPKLVFNSGSTPEGAFCYRLLLTVLLKESGKERRGEQNMQPYNVNILSQKKDDYRDKQSYTGWLRKDKGRKSHIDAFCTITDRRTHRLTQAYRWTDIQPINTQKDIIMDMMTYTQTTKRSQRDRHRLRSTAGKTKQQDATDRQIDR